jgi:peptide/nickel transport system permease protein
VSLSGAVAAPPAARAGEPARRLLDTARRAGLLRRLACHPLGFAALVVVAGVVVACAAAPLLAPYDPQAPSFSASLTGPSASHLLGTDELGRDVLSRMLYGGRPMLLATALATAVAVALGAALGVLAGYRRGWADRVIGVFGDLLLAMPLLAVLIVVLSVFPTSLYPAMVPLGVLLSAGALRVVRAATLSVREELYIDAARVAGLSHRQVMTRHVLRRVVGAIAVQATLVAAVSLVVTTGLAFLGFGVSPPAPTWGSMVADAASQYQQQPWLLVPTGGVVALVVLALGLLGDALTDVIDEPWLPPRARRRRGGRRRRGPARALAARAPGQLLLAPVPGAGAGAGAAATAGGPAGAADATAGGPAGAAAGGGASAGALLAVAGLTVAFDHGPLDLVVVDGVGFSLRQGRTLALVGESGCGKSVTGRALLGVLPPGGRILGGSVRLDGRELLGLSESELRDVRGRRIGFIGQEPQAGLDPTQTVASALREVLRSHRPLSRRAAERRALELLETVRLDDPERVARSYPHQLSGGMAQRVTIARALAGDPEVLIADEPTTALDVTVQADILALLRLLQERIGLSILLITHDWGVVAALADDVAVMYAGQIVELADAREVFARPRHPYTAALLACDPHGSSSGRRLPSVPGAVPSPADWPLGCRFALRCALAADDCRAAPVPLIALDGGRSTRCVHSELAGVSR